MKAHDVDTSRAAAAAASPAAVAVAVADAPVAAPEASRAAPAAVTVAYLINSYPMTTQSFIRREIAALETRGFRVERFALRRWDEKLVDPRDQAELARTRVVLDQGIGALLVALLRTAVTRPVPFMRALLKTIQLGRGAGRKGVPHHLAYLAEACVLLRWFRDAGVPHVHAHFGTNSTTVAMLCRMLGGPAYSFTCHGPEEFDRPDALALREKVERSAFVVGISSFGCSQLMRWARFEDWPKVKQVRCGVDELFLKVPPTPPPAAARVVNVGRIARAKGQYLLVQAVARLVAEGTDVELVLVGDGYNRPVVQKLVDDLKISKHVRITGWMSNDAVREQILASRALAMPSFAEGLPLVVMEALALNRPVLSTYVAGIPELVADGECGWLVPAGSIDALTDALRKVLSAPAAELERMGRNGAARVAQRHNVDTEAATLAGLFREHVNPHA